MQRDSVHAPGGNRKVADPLTHKVAACLIVKNGERIVSECLSPLRQHVDEINVYDTGSTDRTVKILRGLAVAPGAPIRVRRGEWRDDFAWALNQAYAMCSDDVGWYLRVDDDDIVVGAENIPLLVRRAPANLYGFIVVYDHGAFRELKTRLVRRQPGDEWCHPIHEQWEPADPTARDRLVRLDPEMLSIIHRPHDVGKRSDRNARILLRRAAEACERGVDPEPRTLGYVGLEMANLGRMDEAVDWLSRYVVSGGCAGAGNFHLMASVLRDQGKLPSEIVDELATMEVRP